MDNNDDAVIERLQGTLADLLNVRETTLEHGAAMQTALYAALQHEVGRQRRRGRDEAAKLLETRLAEQRQVLAELVAERQRAAIVPVAVPSQSALVDGQVTDTTGRGLAGLRVLLVDRSGEPIKGANPATTDDNGYFALTVAPTDDRTVPSQAHLAVYAADGRLLHRTEQAIALEAARRERQIISLQRGELRTPCPDHSGGPMPAPGPGPAPDPEPGPRPGPGRPDRELIATLDALAGHERFGEIGAGRAQLEAALIEGGILTAPGLARFIERDEREVRDLLRLRNLPSARAFIELVKQLLANR
jgi:hypothetical protein